MSMDDSVLQQLAERHPGFEFGFNSRPGVDRRELRIRRTAYACVPLDDWQRGAENPRPWGEFPEDVDRAVDAMRQMNYPPGELVSLDDLTEPERDFALSSARGREALFRKHECAAWTPDVGLSDDAGWHVTAMHRELLLSVWVKDGV